MENYKLKTEKIEEKVVDDIINDIIAGKIDPGTAFDQAEGWFAEFAAQQE